MSQQLSALFVDEVQCPTQLAEFASSMVYLMWHARKTTHNSNHPSPVGSELAYLMWQSRKPVTKTHRDQSLLYTASPAFKKFCFQVLTATQLQESAVYLSLKYIAILLQSNPSIEGAEGSEYRLFIVALMLANKFLDDNTFTNKTWSDVSGMKVHDLNIMEVEFLEALDYNLFVREHEYDIWKQLLEQCRNHASMSCYDNPQQRQRLVWMILKTLGLYTPQYEYTMNQSNYSHGNSRHSNHCYPYYGQSSAVFKYYQQRDEWDRRMRRLQLENSYRRYQHYLQLSHKMNHVQIPNIMQPSPGYGYAMFSS